MLNYISYLFLLLPCFTYGKKPHVVLIVADDLGYNDVGFRNKDIISPNIDKLAARGVIMENYYVQPICTPSRSQLMTGRYQIRTGLQHSVIFAPQPTCIPLDEVILPQKMKEAGYSTHIIGKWHLGFYRKECLPTHRGFDSFYGYYTGAEDYYEKVQGANCNGTHYTAYDFHDNDEPDFSANGTYSTYLYQRRAVDLISNFPADGDQPLFLYLPFQSVHFPLEVPQRYVDLYSHIKNTNRRKFSGMVTAMDDAIGEVVAALAENGMFEDTLFIFTADNGGQTLFGGNNWPLRGRKATLWEGGVRATGFVSGAGVQGGRVSKEFVHISDWLPTLAHVAGVDTNGTKPLDGIDAWDALSKPDGKSKRTELLHNIDPMFNRPYDPQPKLKPYPNRHGVNTTWGHSALRWGNWKLFTGDPGDEKRTPVPTTNSNDEDLESVPTELQPSVRLYDVVADPTESAEVSEFFPHIVDEMLAKIAAYNYTAVPVSWRKFDCNCDPAKNGGVWEPWM